MATAELNLHSGGRIVSPDDLPLVPCPAPEGRWKPVPHSQVLGYATEALTQAGFEIRDQRLALAHNDQRFFGTLTLGSELAPGTHLAVGLRSSYDKSISLQWACGSRVFVCSNLAFSSEVVIARKHTTFGIDRYQEAICKAVKALPDYQSQEAARIEAMQNRELTDVEAESALLRLFEKGVLSTRTLPDAIREWRTPSHPQFEARNVWSLYNAVTGVLARRIETNPQAHALATIRLGHVLSDQAQAV
jgi:hypothetical protein